MVDSCCRPLKLGRKRRLGAGFDRQQRASQTPKRSRRCRAAVADLPRDPATEALLFLPLWFQQRTAAMAEDLNAVRILVLNYNGRRLLERCLPSVVDCAGRSQRRCRVTVIDNDSTDGSTDWIRKNWPQVEVIKRRNDGLVSFNSVVRRCTESWVMLLNNDVELEPGSVDLLADAIAADHECMFAAPFCLNATGRYEGCLSGLRFRSGLVSTELVDPRSDEHLSLATSGLPTASAGAVLMMRRDAFLSLGGFDDLYLPGRYEDLDLAWRGWRSGWRGLFVNAARAVHFGSATFGRHYGKAVTRLDLRNALLFVWKNLIDPELLLRHLACVNLRLVRSVLRSDDPFAVAFSDALRMAWAATFRRRRLPAPCLTDKALLRLLAPESLSSSAGAKKLRPVPTLAGLDLFPPRYTRRASWP